MADRHVCVTGGASFIGSHLVDALIERGARVVVVDDFSSGTKENLVDATATGRLELLEGDLREPLLARRAVENASLVFHLAADHGGRGYIDLHQAALSRNFALDQNVFVAALEARCEKVVYASSGCVYPLLHQNDPEERLYLTEDMVGPPYEPDGIYGMSKLAGELTLRAMHEEHDLPSVSLRYFTVYGPRGVENHAVTAMIARAFVQEDPFEVWGTGEQVRNWTYVDDIVRGTILAAEMIDDASAINLGTTERIRVMDAVRMVQEHTGRNSGIRFLENAPTGPLNRVASIVLAHKLLGWEPQVCFAEGLPRAIDWYFGTKSPDDVRRTLKHLLMERAGTRATPRNGR